MSSILQGHLENNGFDVIEQKVFHRKYLQEILEYEKPSIVLIHDYYLESDLVTPREKDQEMLRMIDQWRLQYDTSLRVVYLCERDRTDPLLGALVARNVMDIFYRREIPSRIFINQLLEPPKFSNVARIGASNYDLTELQFDEEGNQVKEEPAQKTEEIDQQLDSKNTVIPKPKEEKEVGEEKKKKSIPSITKPSIHIHVHKPSKVEIEQVGIAVDRKIIVVVSPYERSGSTFISHQLAYQIAQQRIGVTYFENPFRRPYTYDRFGGHLQVPEYQSLYAGVLDEWMDLDTERKWVVEGVSIQALSPIREMPYEESDVTIEHYLRLFLRSGDTPILIVDIGSDRHRAIYDHLMEIASHIVVVMDCDISNIEWFEQNRISPDFNWIYRNLMDERTLLVANRFVKAAEEVMPIDEYIPIPVIDHEWIFNSQLKGTFSWSGREAMKVQNQLFGKLLKHVSSQPLLEHKKTSFRLKDWLPKIKVVK